MNSSKVILNILRLGPQRKVTIWDQLLLEEGLHRAANRPENRRNWLVLNHCLEQDPTIVVGFSGKIEKLVNREEKQNRNVNMIRRFTGGGTVIVDNNTVFVSWLLDDSILPNVKPYPKSIMEWSGDFYSKAMKRLGVNGFELRADDYVVNDLKVAGNAQAISGKRWLHHTSFLWDFEDDMMKVLQIPEKRPEYRRNRSHLDFLRRLKELVPQGTSPTTFFDVIESEIAAQMPHVEIRYASIEDVEEILKENPDRRQVTREEV